MAGEMAADECCFSQPSPLYWSLSGVRLLVINACRRKMDTPVRRLHFPSFRCSSSFRAEILSSIVADLWTIGESLASSR